jgi:hypothetical protein
MLPGKKGQNQKQWQISSGRIEAIAHAAGVKRLLFAPTVVE